MPWLDYTVPMIFIGKYTVGKDKVESWRGSSYRLEALGKMSEVEEPSLVEALRERDAMYRDIYLLAQKELDGAGFNEQRGDDIAVRFMLSDPDSILVTIE